MKWSIVIIFIVGFALFSDYASAQTNVMEKNIRDLEETMALVKEVEEYLNEDAKPYAEQFYVLIGKIEETYERGCSDVVSFIKGLVTPLTDSGPCLENPTLIKIHDEILKRCNEVVIADEAGKHELANRLIGRFPATCLACLKRAYKACLKEAHLNDLE